jgi:secreted trypsin-like serine protease
MNSTKRSVAVVAAVLAVAGMAGTAGAQEEIKSPRKRIVGGENTEIKKHPWQVALQQEGVVVCGGSIVAERWIVTAAHCFKDEGMDAQRPAEWRVKANATNYATQGSWVPIERIVVHPQWLKQKTWEHDIALVKLKAKAAGKVIPRATSDMTVPPGEELEITGWGATKEGGPGTEVLQVANIPYVDNATCNAPEAHNGAIDAGMMCAGDAKGEKDACQGDSGGPLVWRRKDGAFLVGVVSWGEGCARKSKYGVYTRVPAYADWIDKTIAEGRR